MANVHPWFGQIAIDNAAQWTFQFFQDQDVAIANQLPNKPQMSIAETGKLCLSVININDFPWMIIRLAHSKLQFHFPQLPWPEPVFRNPLTLQLRQMVPLRLQKQTFRYVSCSFEGGVVLYLYCDIAEISWYIYLPSKPSWCGVFLLWGGGLVSNSLLLNWHSLFRLLMRNGRWGGCCMTWEVWSDVHSRINNMVVLKLVVQSLPNLFLTGIFQGWWGLFNGE